jgi:hypothetical protein
MKPFFKIIICSTVPVKSAVKIAINYNFYAGQNMYFDKYIISKNVL